MKTGGWQFFLIQNLAMKSPGTKFKICGRECRLGASYRKVRGRARRSSEQGLRAEARNDILWQSRVAQALCTSCKWYNERMFIVEPRARSVILNKD